MDERKKELKALKKADRKVKRRKVTLWKTFSILFLVFAIIHILGYIGKYSPLELVMAVLQYLPAGLCLAWSYAKADTIFAPIFVHAAINYITIRTLR